MGITAISSLANAAAAGTSTNVDVENSAQASQPAANTPTDTVQITEAQQVYQLYNQGQQVSQIAQTLSLSVDQVNSYLNISNSGA
jgi:DNA-binding NarL/FixJ family response regulator